MARCIREFVLCRSRGEVYKAVVCAGGSFWVVDGFVIIEEGDNVDLEGEGEEINDGIDYWFKS